jgi:hypothetical protein
MMRNAFNNLVGKLQGKRPLYNIKMDLREIGCGLD